MVPRFAMVARDVCGVKLVCGIAGIIANGGRARARTTNSSQKVVVKLVRLQFVKVAKKKKLLESENRSVCKAKTQLNCCVLVIFFDGE